MTIRRHTTSFTAPSRVVVIGSRGFIGSTLVNHLATAAVPHLALSSADIDLTGAGADERLAALLRPDDAVVMLSALTPDKGRDTATFMRNLTMGLQVSSALEKAPVAHVVYLSSDAVYPMTVGRVTEDSPTDPDNLYGIMHRAREVMFAAKVKAPLAVLRATLIYGAADTHNSYGPSRLYRMASREGKITLFGGGEEMRDHVLVDDAARLIGMVLERRWAGILNLATGNSIDFDGLARKIAALFSAPVEMVHTPRQNAITNRHFDRTNQIKAFPDFHFTGLDAGLAKVHSDMQETS